MKSNYTKYKEWKWYLTLIALIMALVLIIFGFVSKNEKWTRATFLNVNQTNIVSFVNGDDYQSWEQHKYKYIKCLVNDHFYSFNINQSLSESKNDYFKNSIFVEANENDIKTLTKTNTIAVYIESVPWISYFFSNIF